MSQEAPEPKATTTEKPFNRITLPLYLRVTPEGAFIPLDRKKRRAAHYTAKVTIEYPSYEEELRMKQESMRYSEQYHLQQLDYDSLTEARLRRCLIRWDLHESVPTLKTQKLHRYLGALTDDSIEVWKKLPPLVRKAISLLINDMLGPP
jgi:hypothetical protein